LAASISSTDSPPGCPTMNGVPISLKAAAISSTVVVVMLNIYPFETVLNLAFSEPKTGYPVTW
jgi:hypothetical protein